MFQRIVLLASLLAGFAALATAQVNPPVASNVPPATAASTSYYGGKSEIFGGASMQFAKATLANGVSVTTTNVVGGQAGYRYHINDWNAVEIHFAVANPTQLYGPSTTVKSRAEEISGEYVVTIPTDAPIRPYFLGGYGKIHYTPTGNNNTPGAASQSRSALIYGGGLDLRFTQHLSVRLEYRGLIYRVPDFQLIGIAKWNHMPEPVAGLVWHF